MVDSTIGSDYSLCLCSALSAAGVDVTLATVRDREFTMPVTFPVMQWAPGKTRGWQSAKLLEYAEYLRAIPRYAKTHGVNVIHFQFLRKERLESLYMGLLNMLGMRLVYTCHNILPHECRHIDKLLRRIILSSAKVIIAHSRYIHDMLVEEFGVPSGKIRVIPHGDFNSCASLNTVSHSAARSVLNIDPGGDVLLFFGYIRKYKGVDLLFDAFESAARKNPRLHLIIAGAPDKASTAEWCRKQITGRGLQDRVLLRDFFIAPDMVGTYFSACDAVVLPYKEISHSGVVHLAHSFAKPVIVTRVGDFEETIADGRTGFILESNTAEALSETMLAAMKDKMRLAAMGREARRFSDAEYSWSSIALKTRQAYESLASASGASEGGTK